MHSPLKLAVELHTLKRFLFFFKYHQFAVELNFKVAAYSLETLSFNGITEQLNDNNMVSFERKIIAE